MTAPKTDDGPIASYNVKNINSRLKKLETQLALAKTGRSSNRADAAGKRATANEKAKEKRAAGNKAIKASGASGAKVAEKRAAKKAEVKENRATARIKNVSKMQDKRAGMKGNKVAKGAVKARRTKARKTA